MATATLPPPPPVSPVATRVGVNVQDRVAIPGWIHDLASYRAWAHSDDYPQTGWVSYLDGLIWVDMDMEKFFSHNQVKFAFTGTMYTLLQANPLGQFVPDRMLLTNPAANLATEPDGLFFFWATLQTERIRLVPGKTDDYLELEGTPDMVLEIVSQTSQRKDTEILRDLYWKAGITEYWLVDARPEVPRFEILQHGPESYQVQPAVEGWSASGVFSRHFKLVRHTDPLGHPRFVVEVK